MKHSAASLGVVSLCDRSWCSGARRSFTSKFLIAHSSRVNNGMVNRRPLAPWRVANRISRQCRRDAMFILSFVRLQLRRPRTTMNLTGDYDSPVTSHSGISMKTGREDPGSDLRRSPIKWRYSNSGLTWRQSMHHTRSVVQLFWFQINTNTARNTTNRKTAIWKWLVGSWGQK